MVLKVGVVAVQGAVSEHLEAFQRAFRDMGREGEAVPVRRPADMEGVQALAIPGGESTTISRLLKKTGLFELIKRRAEEGMPVLGTCAGLVLLAKEGDEEVRRSGTELMGLMDMAVRRNAFGRQRESFEVELEIRVEGGELAGSAAMPAAPAPGGVHGGEAGVRELPGLPRPGDLRSPAEAPAPLRCGEFARPFPAVFIRAPAITRVWGQCRALARVGEAIVLAQQGNMLAAAFHPELTEDTRIHRLLLERL